MFEGMMRVLIVAAFAYVGQKVGEAIADEITKKK